MGDSIVISRLGMYILFLQSFLCFNGTFFNCNNIQLEYLLSEINLKVTKNSHYISKLNNIIHFKTKI